MSEADIKGNVAALRNAIGADNEAVANAAGLGLLEGALVDLNRVANALEAIAKAAARKAA